LLLVVAVAGKMDICVDQVVAVADYLIKIITQ
jgi:hypothetical protein